MHLKQNCKIAKNSVDSIGVAGGNVCICGSADSKGFTGPFAKYADSIGVSNTAEDLVRETNTTPGVVWIVFILKGLRVIFVDRFDSMGVKRLRRSNVVKK